MYDVFGKIKNFIQSVITALSSFETAQPVLFAGVVGFVVGQLLAWFFHF